MHAVKLRSQSAVVPQFHHFTELLLVWKTLCHLHNTGEHTLEKNLTAVMTVGRLLAKAQTSGITGEFILDRNLTDVVSVAKPLTTSHTSQHIRECIQERNLTNVECGKACAERSSLTDIRESIPDRNRTDVLSMAKPLQCAHILLNMRQSILERNHTDVMSVASILHSIQILWHTRGFIQEKNLILNVINVIRLLSNSHNFEVMRELTLERNFTNGMSVAKPLQDIHILLNIKQSTLEKNLTNVIRVANLLNLQASPGISKYILKTT
ncbi:LOW QUALITY PROTEIN: zinc finger protein 781 [Physeter macrocephalus]|uniref:LOW QUALITY PROTEIN: zinc finger protein 781 n=1 Tax=Physeter macrocephalus TaxID=9755 RepID=A0A9W2W7F6_PHYMC|nr:LOW QUALITY PROTEIN: zinc finger protein 781 [Physeter catodon]